MYGIINQSIENLIVSSYGEETWLKILSHGELDIHDFKNFEQYDDSYTYKLVTSAASILNTSTEKILFAFGEFWILELAIKKYPALMKGGGKDFKEFILNLPYFHFRINLSFPKLMPPDFAVEEDANDLLVQYYSSREGLAPMVEGMLSGIAKMFELDEFMIIHEAPKSANKSNFDLFRIKWKQ